MQPVVRTICCLIALAASASAQTSTALPATPENLRVTLLGTGTPNPRPDRFGPSTLIEAGAERLVFDCGRSCTTRLWQLRIPLGSVKLFITHLHSDHTVGIPDLWLTGWLNLPYGMRKEPFHLWGPQGTSDMMSALQKAYQTQSGSRSNHSVSVEDDEFEREALLPYLMEKVPSVAKSRYLPLLKLLA